MSDYKPCPERTEVYSRVVGYFRPVAEWNNGKRQEFKDRKNFIFGSDSTKIKMNKKGKGMGGIKGFVGLSLLDYPGKISSVIFLGGCNLKCNFCHNADIAFSPTSIPNLDFNCILQKLKERKKVIDGVVLTGGEPTIQKDIFFIAADIKEMGFKVKLDTNGIRPGVLKDMVNLDLVDYVAIDLKTAPGNYISLGGKKDSAKCIKASIAFLKKQTKIEWELRTTFISEIVNDKFFPGMKELIDGTKNYFLQAPVKVDRKKMQNFADLVKSQCSIENFGMRNF
jgi:pyruvate formate lyase activating enzyme